jgi:hypothetical protein
MLHKYFLKASPNAILSVHLVVGICQKYISQCSTGGAKFVTELQKLPIIKYYLSKTIMYDSNKYIMGEFIYLNYGFLDHSKDYYI